MNNPYIPYYKLCNRPIYIKDLKEAIEPTRCTSKPSYQYKLPRNKCYITTGSIFTLEHKYVFCRMVNIKYYYYLKQLFYSNLPITKDYSEYWFDPTIDQYLTKKNQKVFKEEMMKIISAGGIVKEVPKLDNVITSTIPEDKIMLAQKVKKDAIEQSVKMLKQGYLTSNSNF